jgi:hypothetical protein
MTSSVRFSTTLTRSSFAGSFAGLRPTELECSNMKLFILFFITSTDDDDGHAIYAKDMHDRIIRSQENDIRNYLLLTRTGPSPV